MRLDSVVRLLVFGSLTLTIAFGSPVPVPAVGSFITFKGEQMPTPNSGPSNFVGTDCAGGVGLTTSPCIFQGGAVYEIFNATLTHNATNWKLSVNTNAPIGGSSGFDALAFGDALFQSGTDGLGNPVYWGVSLGSYTKNGETKGDLYKENFLGTGVSSFYPTGGPDPNAVYLTAGTAPGGAGYPGGRSNEPVWINSAEMNDVGSSTSFSVTCFNGSIYVPLPTPTCQPQVGGGAYLYTINDTFNAPSDFLSSGTFSFEVASYVCANGLIIGSPGSSVPEPRWLALILPAFLLLGRRFVRSRSVVQQ